MAKRTYRRTKYIIMARFQLKYVLYILFFLYVGAAIAGYTVYYTTWITLGEKLANIYPQSRLVYIYRTANVTLLLRLLLITPFFIFMGIRLSHRIAGPIYRITRYIDSLIQGDYSKNITLRKNDELKSIAIKLSDLTKKLKEESESKNNKILDILKKENVDTATLTKVKTQLGK